MQTIHYRRWCPPESPLEIEFPPELLHEVRLEGGQAATAARLARTRPRDRAEDHSSGILFGVPQHREVRVLAARTSPDLGDPRLAGMHSVGIFVCRARGEVFLTDDDLALFETSQGSVALVVAGGRAGFFVREEDGSVQAVRSHEEFFVANVAATPTPEAAPELPVSPPKRALKRAMTGTGLLCLPVAVLAYLQPLLPQPPIALAMREDAGQLIVGWNAHLKTEGGSLEIVDGPERSIVALAPGQTSVTYSHHAGDVQVHLVVGPKEGFARWNADHYVARIPSSSGAGNAAWDDVLRLEREAKILRSAVERGKARTAELSRRIEELAAP